jgi:hypothetical protein
MERGEGRSRANPAGRSPEARVRTCSTWNGDGPGLTGAPGSGTSRGRVPGSITFHVEHGGHRRGARDRGGKGVRSGLTPTDDHPGGVFHVEQGPATSRVLFRRVLPVRHRKRAGFFRGTRSTWNGPNRVPGHGLPHGPVRTRLRLMGRRKEGTRRHLLGRGMFHVERAREAVRPTLLGWAAGTCSTWNVPGRAFASPEGAGAWLGDRGSSGRGCSTWNVPRRCFAAALRRGGRLNPRQRKEPRAGGAANSSCRSMFHVERAWGASHLGHRSQRRGAFLTGRMGLMER